MVDEVALVFNQDDSETISQFEVAQKKALTAEENVLFEQSKAVFFNAFYDGEAADQALAKVSGKLDQLGASGDLKVAFLKELSAIDYSDLQKQYEVEPFIFLTGCEAVGVIDGNDSLFASDVLCVVPGESSYLALDNQDESEFGQSITVTLSEGDEDESKAEESREAVAENQREASNLIERIEANSLFEKEVEERPEEVDFADFTSSVVDFSLVEADREEEVRSFVAEVENDEPVVVNIEPVIVNSEPVVMSATDTVVEDGSILGVISAFDADGSNLTFSTTSTIEGLTLNADGSYHFDASSYDSLEAGETQAILVFVTATDDQGATSQGTLTIMVTGTNDAPTVAATVDSVEGSGVITGVVSALDVDLADGASLTFSTTSTLTGLTLNADGSYSFDAASYSDLDIGEESEFVVPVTVMDDQGATAETTLTITVKGVNDPGLISGNKTGDVTEDGAAAEQQTSGTLSVVDEDAGEAAFVVQTNYAGSYGTFSLTAEGDWTYVLTNSNSSVQALGVGQTLTDTIVVTTEGGDVGAVVVTINGTNDDLVLTSASVDVGVIEDSVGVPEASDIEGVLAASSSLVFGQIPVTNIDGDTLTYTVSSSTPAPGAFTLNPNGTWQFEEGKGDYDYLSEGETFDEVIDVIVDDGQGSQVTYRITVTVTGVNDGPVGIASSGEVLDNAVVTGQIDASDVDLPDGASLVFSTTSSDAGITLSADGSYRYDGSAHNDLKAGETTEVGIPVTVTDDRGATNTVNLTITVTGTNDAPTLAADINRNVDEGSGVSSISVIGTDVDGDSLTYTLSDESAGFSLSSGALGFNSNDGAYDELSEGETTTATATVTVDDGNGGTDTQTISITVTGTNDAPVAESAEDSVVEDAVITGDLSDVATDVDLPDGASLTFSAKIDVAGFTLSEDGSYTFDASSYDSLEEDETLTLSILYTVTDDQGATDSKSLAITITGTNDAPVAAADTSYDVFEDGDSIFGPVLGTDAERDDLTYSLKADSAEGFILSGTSWRFDPKDAAYDSLAEGQSVTVSATIVVEDTHGATDEQVITVTVTADTTGTKSATLDEVVYEEVGGILTGANTLTLTFEEDIDVSTLELTDLVLSNGQSWGDDAVLIAVYDDGVESTGYTDTFTVDRGTASELDSVTSIDVSAGVFEDQAGNLNEAFVIA